MSPQLDQHPSYLELVEVSRFSSSSRSLPLKLSMVLSSQGLPGSMLSRLPLSMRLRPAES